MTAEVFRLTDLTPLMDSKTIRRLASEGAFFGSHLATHRAIACRGRAAAPAAAAHARVRSNLLLLAQIQPQLRSVLEMIRSGDEEYPPQGVSALRSLNMRVVFDPSELRL